MDCQNEKYGQPTSIFRYAFQRMVQFRSNVLGIPWDPNPRTRSAGLGICPWWTAGLQQRSGWWRGGPSHGRGAGAFVEVSGRRRGGTGGTGIALLESWDGKSMQEISRNTMIIYDHLWSSMIIYDHLMFGEDLCWNGVVTAHVHKWGLPQVIHQCTVWF